MPEAVTWAELRRARPDLADAGRDLLYQYGVGLAFLATVRRDGGPRLHPMCPILTEHGLFADARTDPALVGALAMQFMDERGLSDRPTDPR